MTHKILIVGHPQSGLDSVESLLQAAGMAPARASRREGLAPAQIDAMLCAAHGVQAGAPADPPRAIRQLEVGAVWNGLALDLLMANLDQPLWGWADAQALHLLDYWCATDPQLQVVMVYDHPAQLLTRCPPAEAAALTPARLAGQLHEWADAQEALLHFHYRHPQRTLLIHAEAARSRPQEVLQQLGQRLPGPWHMPARLPNAEPAVATADLQHQLARHLVNTDSRALPLYEEQQGASAAAVIDPPLTTDDASWLSAWHQWALQARQVAEARRAGQQLADDLQAAQTRLEAAEAEHAAAQARWQVEQAQVLADLQAAHEQEREADRRTVDDAEARLTAAQAEHAAALLQLESVLARQHAEAHEQQARAHALAQAQQRADHERERERERERLGEQLAAAEGRLLAAETARVQAMEQLQAAHQRDLEPVRAERAAAVHQLSLRDQALRLTQIELHRAQAQLEQLAATVRSEKASQERQRLQAEKTLAEQGEVLRAEVAASRREAMRRGVERDEALEKLRQQDQTLQAQLRQQEQALQAHLRETLQTQQREMQQAHQRETRLLLEQLHRAQEELEARLRQAAPAPALAPALVPPPTAAPVGAANRVRQQLSYRLGATMIEHSRSIGGWLSLPWALQRTHQAYRQDLAARGEVKLPPLQAYVDRDEADRVRQHLSYRLGSTLLAQGRSPVSWVTLPFALQREVRQFRQERLKVVA